MGTFEHFKSDHFKKTYGKPRLLWSGRTISISYHIQYNSVTPFVWLWWGC